MNPVGYLETNVLYCDDNLDRLAEFPAECIDLIYLDPPFFSNRHYEVIWGDEAEVRSFEDRWQGGINVYVDWMRERLLEIHRILKPTGSLYLHCDPSASHYLKVMLDPIFEGSNGGFRSEIIWKRSSAHSDTKQGRRIHGHIHDVILFYTKGREWTWNPIYTPYDEAYVKSKYRHVDPESGRRFRLDNLTAAKPGGDTSYEWHGRRPYRGRFWAYSREKMDQFLKEGRIRFPTKADGVPELKRYLDEMPGVPLQDLWTDLDPINAKAAERLGYPTQKPETLLERIIESSSDEGQIVLDPFCGCGTTIAVAQRLKRQWIGIDISPTAVGLMSRRAKKLGAEPKVVGLPTTEVDLRTLKPFEFQNWVMQRINGTPSPKKSGDMGIDGLSFMYHEPIQVKQSYGVGRNVVDNFETAVERSGKDRGYIVAFSFTKGAYEEAARARSVGKTNIALITVAELVEASESITRPAMPKPKRRPTPDLMRLLSALTKSAKEQPIGEAGPRSSRPSAQKLVESAKQSVAL